MSLYDPVTNQSRTYHAGLARDREPVYIPRHRPVTGPSPDDLMLTREARSHTMAGLIRDDAVRRDLNLLDEVTETLGSRALTRGQEAWQRVRENADNPLVLDSEQLIHATWLNGSLRRINRFIERGH
jgi:hypothetical protein